MLRDNLHIPIGELFAKLAADGLPLGMEAHIRVRRYFASVAEKGDTVALEKLKFQLAALLCQTIEQQDRFYKIFDEFIEPFTVQDEEKPPIISPPPPERPPSQELPPPSVSPPPPTSSRTHEEKRTPTTGRSGPIRIELTFPANNFRAWNTQEIDQAVRPLREKEWAEVHEWDIAASIRHTIRAGGIPQFVMRRRKKAPQYLLLIDQKSPRDHLADLYADLVTELRRRDLDIEFYYYDFVPYRCWRDPRDPQSYTTIESLQSQFAGYKLLIVGEVDGLLDLPDLRPSNLALELFDNWREVALFSPKSTADWGDAELSLCPLFPVVPANALGLSALVQQWNATEVFTPVYWKVVYPEPALPIHIADDDAEDALKKSIESLYYYLGDNGFQWLCAAAVYPEIYWELTKLLHDESIPPDRNLNEWDQNRTWQISLLRLSRVRWFRQGNIPTAVRAYLRQYFETQLPPEQRREIRHQLLEVLGMAENQPPPNTYAAANQAFTIAWYEYEHAIAAPRLSDAERTRIETEFREKSLAKINLSDIEDAIGRKIWEEAQDVTTWPPPPDEPGFHILWVDDEPERNARFQEELGKQMHVISTNARNTEEAIEVLAKQGFDLIVSDMRRRDNPQAGLEMMRILRSRGLITPAVFFTIESGMERYRQELVELDVLEILSERKPEREFIERLVSEKARQKAAPPSPESAFRILWVDDFPRNNDDIIHDLTEKLGATFTQVVSTEEALEHLNKGTFDAIISDLGRGDTEWAGLELLEELRKKQITIPSAIFCSTRRADENRERLLGAGAQLVTGSGTQLRKWVEGLVSFIFMKCPNHDDSDIQCRQLLPVKNGRVAWTYCKNPKCGAGPLWLCPNCKQEVVNLSVKRCFNCGFETAKIEVPDDVRKLITDALRTEATFEKTKGAEALKKGNYEQAEQHLQKALKILEDLDDEDSIVDVLRALAEIEVLRQNFEKAREFLSTALEKNRQSKVKKEKEEAEILNSLGEVTFELGDIQEAKKIFEESLKLSESIAHHVVQALAQENLGKCEQSTGDLATVLHRFRIAKDIFARIDNKQKVSEIERNIADLEKQMASKNKGGKEQIQQLIAAGQTKDALEMLAKMNPDALLLQAQYNNGEKQFNLGLIDFGDWGRIQSRVNFAALEMVGKIEEEKPEKKGGKEGAPYKVLIIDDDISFHKDIRNAPAFQEYFEFHTALDAHSAMKILDSELKFDLVLLDSFLDGLNLIPAIKERYPSIPIIVVTYENNIGTAVHATKLGAADYLFKGDYNPEDWNMAFRKALGEKVTRKSKVQNVEKIIRIFISYSHRDKTYFDVFKNDFQDYANLPGFRVDTTTDCEIPLGAKWDEFLRSKVHDCHVMLLLVSQTFMNSEYIQVKEFGAALKRLKRGDRLIIVPIYFAPCFFRHNTDLAQLQFFKPHGKDFGHPGIGNEFSYTDLVGFNKDGELIANENSQHYMRELMNRLGPELKKLAPMLYP